MKKGAALIVVMWVLVIVSMIVSSFAFEMQMEARIISAQRKRFKADQLALAGVELAKAMLAFKPEAGADKDTIYEDPYLTEAARITNGVPVNYSEEFGDGTVKLRIDYEKGRRYIPAMKPEDWRMLFEQAGIPNTRWDELIDCLIDWQDEGDLHQLNGAESDDPFYRKRGYECKNAPVDTVDELLLIKGWTPEILYGTPPGEETDALIAGIAKQLTLDRDPHGNVQVSRIETEKLLIEMVEKQLSQLKRQGIVKVKFSAQSHFFGYEGRCAVPSNFDADYCYSLGQTAAFLIADGKTGYMACVRNTTEPSDQWVACGVPITMMMNMERRNGVMKPVIQKALVRMDGAPFRAFAAQREEWAVKTSFVYPGPIQYWGPTTVCDATTKTLQLEKGKI